jgi:hypothetical protein
MIFIFDVEGIPLAQRNIHEISKIAWVLYDEIKNEIILAKEFEIKYNLYRYDKNIWIGSYRWLKRNMPTVLKDNKPKSNIGIGLNKARKIFLSDCEAYNISNVYAKGLSDMDTSFTCTFGNIKCYDLMNLNPDIPKATCHSPLQEIYQYIPYVYNGSIAIEQFVPRTDEMPVEL